MDLPNEMHVKYLERRKHDLEECIFSLKAFKYPVLEKIGHQLKGNGTTFGHPELSEIGYKLELGAINQDLTLIDEALKEFSTWILNSIN